MLQDPARVDELFPTAKELFDRIAARRRTTSWVTWTLGAVLVFVLSRRALRWIDRNL